MDVIKFLSPLTESRSFSVEQPLMSGQISENSF